MADADGNKVAKDYHLDTPAAAEGFFAKGLSNTDWGFKHRFASMFNPESGNTVMLAFDHGYIMGATAGLERLDIVIPPLAPYVNVLMGTRGAIRSCISPVVDKPVCLRATHDTSVLFDDMSVG
ncbi:MAG: 3-hydroxy-5-phosphonooxypentane-2,4-dione thiolase LsrF, partial [Oscillospiraceae bacterium]|nr:3-hydroxy-5-phosphonooxypentane-2,4-dione thiolase LsrF [Oscillospiraceae bacterium]